MADPTEARHAKRAAAAAEARPAFLASVLARYREQERLGDEGLARRLGLPPEQLPWLALCHRPRPEVFQADVVAIADRFGMAPAPLAAVIRQVDALAALNEAPNTDVGRLAAARDHEDDEGDAE